jgi:hypothetical protein
MISAPAAKAVAAIFSQWIEFQQLEFQKTTLRSMVFEVDSVFCGVTKTSSIEASECPDSLSVGDAEPEFGVRQGDPTPVAGVGGAKSNTVGDEGGAKPYS